MSLFRQIVSFMSGGTGRNKGMQISGPGQYNTPAATNVTVDTAMQLSAVFACTRLITESIGSLPINFYKKKDNGVKVPFPDHPLAQLFRGKVNKFQTRQEFFESLTYQYVLQGNNYAAKQYGSNGDIVSIMPLMTPQMNVKLEDHGLEYHYTEDNGLRVFAEKTIWHNKLFGNGIIGVSPLAYARNSVGIGQAAEQSTTNIYKNGGKPSGILMIDKTLTEDQRIKIKNNFSELAEGNNDRLFVLEADMKFEQVSLSPQDIELLASRRFQIEDICRFFGVPAILVNDSQASTAWGSGIEQIIQGFYKFGLRPYLERYEASMKANLLSVDQRDTVEIEFDFNALLQPSKAERVKTGKEAVTGALITPNEYRVSEGLPEVPGGDSIYMQQQMVPVDELETMEQRGNENGSK